MTMAMTAVAITSNITRKTGMLRNVRWTRVNGSGSGSSEQSLRRSPTHSIPITYLDDSRSSPSSLHLTNPSSIARVASSSPRSGFRRACDMIFTFLFPPLWLFVHPFSSLPSSLPICLSISFSFSHSSLLIFDFCFFFVTLDGKTKRRAYSSQSFSKIFALALTRCVVSHIEGHTLPRASFRREWANYTQQSVRRGAARSMIGRKSRGLEKRTNRMPD